MPTQSLRLTLTGIAVGDAAPIARTRFLASLLFGVAATDPFMFTAVCVPMLGIAVVARRVGDHQYRPELGERLFPTVRWMIRTDAGFGRRLAPSKDLEVVAG